MLVMAQTPNRLLSLGVPAHRYHAQRQRQLRVVATKLAHSKLWRAWATWRSLVQQRQAQAAMLQHVVALWSGRTTARAFRTWAAWAAASREQREAGGTAVQQYARQLQRRALLAFWLAMLHRQQQRWAEYQAVGHMQGW